jgi:hypothetical protein
MDLQDLNSFNWPEIIENWAKNFDGRKPCYGLNTNVCVGEGCYNEACLEVRKKADEQGRTRHHPDS